MNFRVILLIIIVIVFTIGGILISLMSFEANSLKEAYGQGTVDIIQNTTAGTVPHTITVKNNGKKPLMIEKGQILISSTSQDLVVAEDKQINQNSSSLVKAYCFQPNQSAVPGSKLIPSDKASTQIIQIIDNSNPSDLQNATKTQIQIWIIVSKDNINPNTGEASSFLERHQISSGDLLQQISEARNNLIKGLNVTAGEIKNINQTSAPPSINDAINWINQFINWIKNSFGIG